MPTCLIVGAAPSDGASLRWVLDNAYYDYVMAVDGGFEKLKALGVEPDEVFGDFDSLGYTPEHPRVATFEQHKDFTDMELAIQHAYEQGFADVIMCDALTARVDHTLGNLQLLIKAASWGMRVWGFTDDQVCVALNAPGPLDYVAFDEGAFGVMSALSHSDVATGVTEEGFEYSLEGATVLNRAVWGVSNELIGKPARISLEQGSIWVFMPLSALEVVEYGSDGRFPLE